MGSSLGWCRHKSEIVIFVLCKITLLCCSAIHHLNELQLLPSAPYTAYVPRASVGMDGPGRAAAVPFAYPKSQSVQTLAAEKKVSTGRARCELSFDIPPILN